MFNYPQSLQFFFRSRFVPSQKDADGQMAWKRGGGARGGREEEAEKIRKDVTCTISIGQSSFN